jgi:hypothetical protein
MRLLGPIGAGLGVLGLCCLSFMSVYRMLTGAQWESFAPPPERPKAVAPIKLPDRPQAPKFKFFTGGPRRSMPVRAQAPAQAPEPAAVSLADVQRKIIKKIRKVKIKKKKRKFKPRGLSSVIGGQGSSSAHYQTPQAPARQAPPQNFAAPASPSRRSTAPKRQRKMRSVAQSGSVVPDEKPAAEQFSDDEENADYYE